MASTVNSASGNAPSQNSSGRASLRPSASTRVPDNRRQSPVDGGTRRSNSQKAWTQGTNPITQRYSQQNGNMSHQKQSASLRPAPKESNTSDNHAHDRLIFLVTSFIGLNAVVTTKSGEKFIGIFSSSTLEASESSFVLKMVQRASKQDQQGTNGVSDGASPFLGSAPSHSMSFDAKEVVDISVANVSPADVTTKPSNGASAGFRTDTDISGNLAIRERTLKRWEPAADDAADMSLESSTDTTGWDQFETNERVFGGKSNYDESFYTTTINRADPTYKQKEADAARIAREIEGSEADNVHIKEERGLATGGTGEDEEEKYSGVRRDEKNFPPLVSGQPNKYTPPARRQAAPQVAAPAGAPASSAKQPAAPTSGAAPAQAQPKEPVPSQPQQGQPAAAAKTTTEAPQKSVPDKAAASSTTTAPKRTAADNATANVETEVLDHFRQFANSEKLKMQERRRNQASYDRNIKLNELMKFSKNFKLATPVPKDLVPILAKDPHKQETIITRAQLQSEEDKPNTQATPATDEQKPATHTSGPARYESGTMPPHSQNFNRGRQVYTPTGPNAAGQGGRFQNQNTQPGRPSTGMLSHRLADNLQQRKGVAMGSVPTPLPINDARLPPTGPAGERSALTSPSKSQTPASSKFNVRAMEFKPNPAASTFTPGAGAAASPQPLFRGRSISRASSPSAFFGAKKPRPVAERASLTDQFNPIKRMKKESSEQTDKDFSFNGGIPPAYRTLPTWDVPAGNEEKTYSQMFKPVTVPTVPQSRAASNPQMPHQPQMPFPFQQPGMPPVSGPPGPHLHPQQHHSGPPHFDDPHRMQLSSSSSQIFPSPRLQHNHVAYPSPMVPHAQLAFQQPGMPQFYVNQGAPQPSHMRHYPGAPQFMNPQGAMAAPMMVQQPSGGPYMGVPQGMAPYTPQMQMYSPSPGHAYPQPPPQPQSGFPSPSRGAPMMMHQNSQPGQPPQPVMFMGQPGQPMYPGQQPGHMPPVRGNYQQQPQFQSSPHQGHQYPPHQHRTPSSGYNQVPQMAPQMPPSQPPPTVTSGPHPPEAAADEVK